jgi:protein gp37
MPGYVVPNDESRTVAKDYKWTGAVNLVPKRLEEPARWKKPRRVFVCSMSDLLHENVPDDYLDRVWDVMETEERHTFQVLTKRPARLRDYLGQRPPGHPLGFESLNIWIGTSVEDAKRAEERTPILRDTPAAVRWLSIEPLLGPIGQGLDLSGIDWVVLGGESGPHFRPMDPDWAREVRDACIEQGVPFFYKQPSGARQPPKDKPATLDGRVWHMFPGDSHA